MSTTVPDDWRVFEDRMVPLSDVARSVQQHGVSYDAVSAAARQGLFDIVRQAGPGAKGPVRYITLDSALLALAVAALCELLKAAFQTVLRAVRDTGAQVIRDGSTFTLRAA